MDYQSFIHPEDAAALKTLQAIPALPKITKAIMDIQAEQLQTGLNLATKIKLSPRQLPELYNILPPLCEQLGIKEPDFYLMMSPEPNASAFGDTQTAITITSGLVELMTEEELRAAIAHECGHIFCHHMLYSTLVSHILNNTGVKQIIGKLVAPVTYALLYWNRKSELSCDRVAAYLTSPKAVASMLARSAGGPKTLTANLDIAELAAQADQYDALCKLGLWNKALQMYAVRNSDHPFASVRLREMLLWVDSDGYKQMIEQEQLRCPNCHNAIDRNWHFCQHCGSKL